MQPSIYATLHPSQIFPSYNLALLKPCNRNPAILKPCNLATFKFCHLQLNNFQSCFFDRLHYKLDKKGSGSQRLFSKLEILFLLDAFQQEWQQKKFEAVYIWPEILIMCKVLFPEKFSTNPKAYNVDAVVYKRNRRSIFDPLLGKKGSRQKSKFSVKRDRENKGQKAEVKLELKVFLVNTLHGSRAGALFSTLIENYYKSLELIILKLWMHQIIESCTNMRNIKNFLLFQRTSYCLDY